MSRANVPKSNSQLAPRQPHSTTCLVSGATASRSRMSSASGPQIIARSKSVFASSYADNPKKGNAPPGLKCTPRTEGSSALSVTKSPHTVPRRSPRNSNCANEALRRFAVDCRKIEHQFEAAGRQYPLVHICRRIVVILARSAR